MPARPVIGRGFQVRLFDDLLGRLSPRPRPLLFISGMPKSGTTAILELMGIASGCATVNDPFHRLDRRGVVFRDDLYGGRVTLGQLIERHPRVFRGEIIKDPNLIFFFAELAEGYPDTGWVFTIRDPRDNIRSLLNRLKLRGRAEALEPLPDNLGDTWRRVLEGRTPEIPGRDPIERLANRWVRMAEVVADAGERVIVSRYEDFVRAKERHVEKLCQNAGLEARYSIAEHVDRDFQPKGDRNVVWSEFFGERELRCIEGICGEWMQRFGYGPADGAR